MYIIEKEPRADTSYMPRIIRKVFIASKLALSFFFCEVVFLCQYAYTKNSLNKTKTIFLLTILYQQQYDKINESQVVFFQDKMKFNKSVLKSNHRKNRWDDYCN